MRPDIHPNYAEIQVTCSCGHTFTTGSSLGKNLHIEVCNECHPFYTGKQKIVDTAGRVERFKNKFTNFSKTHADNKAATPAPKAPAKATKKSVKKEKSSDSDTVKK